MLLAARYYQQQISLHDLEDVEGVCRAVARRFWKQSCAGLAEQDFELLVVRLVEDVVMMGERFDPSRGSPFSAHVRGRLGNRCVDWVRQHNGRTRWQFGDHTYEREIERSVSLDAPAGADGSPLADVVGSSDGDPAAGDLADPCGGLLDDRDGEADWDLALCRALAARLLRERSSRARAA